MWLPVEMAPTTTKAQDPRAPRLSLVLVPPAASEKLCLAHMKNTQQDKPRSSFTFSPFIRSGSCTTQKFQS